MENKKNNDYLIMAIPEWALCYLYYGDESNLSEEDKKLCDDFLKKYRFVSEKDEQPESYFTHYPEFGLACNVIDCYCQEV